MCAILFNLSDGGIEYSAGVGGTLVTFLLRVKKVNLDGFGSFLVAFTSFADLMGIHFVPLINSKTPITKYLTMVNESSIRSEMKTSLQLISIAT